MAETQVSSSSQDLIAILNADDFTQVFPLAALMQVTVRELAKIPSFTVEDGTDRADNFVELPTEIDIPLLLQENQRSVFASIKQAWKKQSSFIVQTKVETYKDMCIYEMPHDETGEQGDSIAVTLKLRAIIAVTPEYGALPPRKVADKSQASTVKKGQQQTTEANAATKRKGSLLSQIYRGSTS